MSLAFGGIGFDRKKALIFFPTCKVSLSSPPHVAIYPFPLYNYFDQPLQVLEAKILSSALCQELLTVVDINVCYDEKVEEYDDNYYDPDLNEQRNLSTMRKRRNCHLVLPSSSSPLNPNREVPLLYLSFEVNKARKILNELRPGEAASFPLSCSLEIATNLSTTHRIPLHISSGQMQFSFFEEEVVERRRSEDVLREHSEEALDRVEVEDIGKEVEDTVIYEVNMGDNSFKDPRPLELVITNPDPQSMSISLSSSSVYTPYDYDVKKKKIEEENVAIDWKVSVGPCRRQSFAPMAATASNPSVKGHQPFRGGLPRFDEEKDELFPRSSVILPDAGLSFFIEAGSSCLLRLFPFRRRGERSKQVKSEVRKSIFLSEDGTFSAAMLIFTSAFQKVAFDVSIQWVSGRLLSAIDHFFEEYNGSEFLFQLGRKHDIIVRTISSFPYDVFINEFVVPSSVASTYRASTLSHLITPAPLLTFDQDDDGHDDIYDEGDGFDVDGIEGVDGARRRFSEGCKARPFVQSEGIKVLSISPSVLDACMEGGRGNYSNFDDENYAMMVQCLEFIIQTHSASPALASSPPDSVENGGLAEKREELAEKREEVARLRLILLQDLITYFKLSLAKKKYSGAWKSLLRMQKVWESVHPLGRVPLPRLPPLYMESPQTLHRLPLPSSLFLTLPLDEIPSATHVKIPVLRFHQAAVLFFTLSNPFSFPVRLNLDIEQHNSSSDTALSATPLYSESSIDSLTTLLKSSEFVQHLEPFFQHERVESDDNFNRSTFFLRSVQLISEGPEVAFLQSMVNARTSSSIPSSFVLPLHAVKVASSC